MNMPIKRKRSFTIIELLVVIAIVGILSAAILVAINPAKRAKQARDAQRKNDIGAITNALISYEAITGSLPGEKYCDTSIGGNQFGCPSSSVNSCWDGCYNPGFLFPYSINHKLVIDEGLLKKLPVDPLNNALYHYRYEPRNTTET